MKRMPKSKVLFRNKSPYGWWVFREIHYWVSNRQKTLLPTSRCPIWENTRIIKAKNRDQAFAKASRLAHAGYPSKTDGGEWRCAGISQLLPIYEEIEDGAEIMWDKYKGLPFKSITQLARTKHQLSVFDDRTNSSNFAMQRKLILKPLERNSHEQ